MKLFLHFGSCFTFVGASHQEIKAKMRAKISEVKFWKKPFLIIPFMPVHV